MTFAFESYASGHKNCSVATLVPLTSGSHPADNTSLDNYEFDLQYKTRSGGGGGDDGVVRRSSRHWRRQCAAAGHGDREHRRAGCHPACGKSSPRHAGGYSRAGPAIGLCRSGSAASDRAGVHTGGPCSCFSISIPTPASHSLTPFCIARASHSCFHPL